MGRFAKVRHIYMSQLNGSSAVERHVTMNDSIWMDLPKQTPDDAKTADILKRVTQECDAQSKILMLFLHHSLCNKSSRLAQLGCAVAS